MSDDEYIIPRLRIFIHKTIPFEFESSSEEHEEERSSTDNSPILKKFLGHPVINVDNVPESITNVLNLFIEDNLLTYFVEESNRYLLPKYK